MILGAILAGGQARRFGADKAAAEIDGVAMLDRIAAQLRPQVDALVVVGREWPGLRRVEDLPHAGLGPLGGLAGALAYARAQDFAEVLTSGCDLPDVPAKLAALLAPAPAVVRGQPLLGLWPAGLADGLFAWLETGGDRSMRGWIGEGGARIVPVDRDLPNINTPADLAAYLNPSAARRSSR